jgi:hypothetical protein
MSPALNLRPYLISLALKNAKKSGFHRGKGGARFQSMDLPTGE